MIKISRILLKILLGLMVVLCLALLSVKTRFVQKRITEKVEKTINNQLKEPIRIELISIVFFNRVNINNITWTDGNNDTVVYFEKIEVAVSLRKLIDKQIKIRKFNSTNGKINLVINKSDSTLNLTNLINTDPAEPTEENKDSQNIEVSSVSLKNIHFQFDNRVDSSLISFRTGEAKLNNLLLNPGLNKYETRTFSIDGGNLKMISGGQPKNEQPDTAALPDLRITKSIEISNTSVDIRNQKQQPTFELQSGEINITTDSIYLPRNYVAINILKFTDTEYRITSAQQESNKNSDTIQPGNAVPWNIKINHLGIDNNTLQLNEYQNKELTSRTLENINTNIDSIEVDLNNYEAVIHHLRFSTGNMELVRNLSGSIHIADQKAKLKNLVLDSEYGNCEITAQLQYPQLNAIAAHISDTKIDAIFSGKINTGTLPVATKYLKDISKETTFTGALRGTLDTLFVDSIFIENPEILSVRTRGKLLHALSKEKLAGNLVISHLRLNNTNLVKYIPDSLLPEQIQLPDSMQISGNVNVNPKIWSGQIVLKTPKGKIKAGATVNTDSIKDKEYAELDFTLDSVNLGYYLKMQDTLGLMHSHGKIKSVTEKFKNPSFNLALSVDSLQYLDKKFNQWKLNATYKDSLITVSTNIDNPFLKTNVTGSLYLRDSIVKINTDIDLENANLKFLNLSENEDNIALKMHVDVQGKNWKTIQGNANIKDIVYSFDNKKIKADSLLFTFEDKNDSTYYTLHSFGLMGNDSLIAKESNVDMRFKNQGGNIKLKIINTPDYIASLKGDFYLHDDSILFTPDIHITSKYYNKPLQFATRLNMIQNDEISLLNVIMTGNDIALRATSNFGENKTADIYLDSLNLQKLIPFTQNQFRRLDGILKGQLTYDQNSTLDGYLQFNNVMMNPVAINTPLKLANERITIKNNLIKLSSFTILDKNGNKAKIDGTAYISGKERGKLNLKLNAGNFQLLDKPAVSAQTYYGKISADINASVTGNTNNPEIDLKTKFSPSSEFYFILPQTKVMNNEGVVEFRGAKSKGEDEYTQENLLPETHLKFKSNVELTNNLKITIIINPANNEKVEFRGSGDLHFAISNTGYRQLIGRYNISEGKYSMNIYSLLQREFKIRKGSYINWSGDLLNPDVNITAVYSLKASTGQLMLKYAYTSDVSANMDQYNKLIPIDVVLQITGSPLAPELNFDIELPKQYSGTDMYAAIKQLNNNESELNKQVFSLLIFNSFLTENKSGLSPVSYELTNTARQNLSNLLSNQLTRFANEHIKSVDLAFNVDSYNQYNNNSSVSRTDIDVNVSRKLLNDRLDIEVGGSLMLEENQQQSRNVSFNNLAGDFKVEYKLTPNGTYRIQVFNASEYVNEFESDVTKTGISLIFNKSFYELQNLFKQTGDTIK